MLTLAAASFAADGGVLAPVGEVAAPSTPTAETARRLTELRRWADSVGDDTAGVERLMALPALNGTINGAILLSASGERLSEELFRGHAADVRRSGPPPAAV